MGEVRIDLSTRDEHYLNVNESQPGSFVHAKYTDTSLPLMSSRTSFSSGTDFDRRDSVSSHQYAFDHDQHRWSQTSASSETLVGSFIENPFPSLKNRLLSSLAGSRYSKLVSEDLHPASRRPTRRKKLACLVFLLAALILGIGSLRLRNNRKSKWLASLCRPGDSFCLSLHDEDSLQDASIHLPTLPRPEHPLRAEEVLPFALHHYDIIAIAPSVPSPSAANRRQLDTIPSQRLLFDKQECLEAWLAHGIVCEALNGIYRERSDLTHLDLMYSWVNGSDWRHSAAKWMHGYRPTGRWQEYVEEDLFPSASSSQHQPQSSRRSMLAEADRDSESTLMRRSGAALQSRFRDHQELRYSIRTAVKYLHGLSTIHIIAPDFSAPYHLQLDARQSIAPSGKRGILSRLASSLRRRSSDAPFMLDVNRLKEAFLGLPSQLRRKQGLGTDRFTTDEGQIREGQVPQWLSLANNSIVLAGQAAATDADKSLTDSISESLSKLFSSTSSVSSSQVPVKVRLHHDWNTFKDNWLVTEPLTTEERKHRDDYRRAALPTFNSMAIEAMLGDEPGLRDTFIYSNDDFFLVDDASSGDISSPLFGPVLRLDYNLLVKGEQFPDATAGEWSSLWHTNWLLDQRFGPRKRPYIQHVHKSFSKSLLLETRMGWAHEHARVALQRFRKGGNNLVTHFLAYYNIVERHREALLWSFFMLKLDEDGDGVVSSQELSEALSQMGLTPSQATTTSHGPSERNLTVIVRLAKRTTLKEDSANAVLIQTGWPVPLNSRYAFVSQDGYPLGDVSSQVISRRSEALEKRRVSSPSSDITPGRGETTYFGWPDFVNDPSLHPNNEWYNRRFERTACELDLDRCLIRPFSQLRNSSVSWEDVFKQFAYADGACGDCLIHHLMGQSGERGLSAFLPAADRTFSGKTDPDARFSNEVPHLPLTSVWNSSMLQMDSTFEPERPCFSVSCVLANSGFGHGTSLRTFASKLIQRYAYTIAESPIRFKQLETQYNSRVIMLELEESMKQPTALERFKQQQHKDGIKADAWLESQRKIDNHRPVFVCINDDITDRWVQSVGDEFTNWLAKAWPNKQPWEL